MHPLKKIRVAGYKSIRDQEVELSALNLLIGANGAGKSNFISIFRLLNSLVNSNLQLTIAREGGPDQLLHFGRKATDHLTLDLRFGPDRYSCRLEPTAGNSLIFASEEIVHQYTTTGYDYDVPLGVGHAETQLVNEAQRHGPSSIAAYVVAAFRSWSVYHFHDTSYSAKVKLTADVGDNLQLRPDAANLAAFLYLLQETQPQYFQNIQDVVRLVAPFFDAFALRPDRHNEDKIRLEWKECGSSAYFNAHALSDGTLRFICLATLLLQPDLPTTVVIDEPELGLHPYAVTLLASMLRSAAARTQLVVSTQSVTLVNQFSPEELLVVDRVGSESVFRRLGEDDTARWLEDYSLGELWEKNLLGGRPR